MALRQVQWLIEFKLYTIPIPVPLSYLISLPISAYLKIITPTTLFPWFFWELLRLDLINQPFNNLPDLSNLFLLHRNRINLCIFNISNSTG